MSEQLSTVSIGIPAVDNKISHIIGNYFAVNGHNILMLMLILLGILAFIKISGINMNPTVHRELKKEVVYENFDNDEGKKLMNIIREPGFCKHHVGNGQNLEEACNKLGKKSCDSVSCCVRVHKHGCVAGDRHGPTFRTDKDGNSIDVDYYYYKGKCIGTRCPQ